MEKRGVESLFMVFVILGLLVGQSAADFKDCYGSCFLTCMIFERDPVKCGSKCLKACIGSYSSQNLKHTDYFCKLGCANSLCTNLSTKLDPAVEKVEGCVNSCSETCSKN